MILLDSWVSEALTSSMLVAIPVAVLAGIVSFASPCVLPLLPGYLSYASGLGARQIAEGTASPEGAQLGGFWIVESPDEAAARALAGEASYACGQPVELRRLQG